MTIAVALLSALVAMALGIAGGWLVWGRESAALRSARDAERDRFGRAVAELAAAEERAKRAAALQVELDATRSEREAARIEAQRLKSESETRALAYEEQIARLLEAKELLGQQFGEVGARLLEEAQRRFLESADQRFRQSEEKAGVELKALLHPVTERLQRYEEGVVRVEQERREAYGNLTGLMESMRAGQDAVRAEAARLVNSLRSAPKARGRWGEQQLRNVLETCGLSEHCDFRTEVSVEGEDGRLRPDAIVKVPGGRALVIDAKVSLNAYQDAFGAVDEAERHARLADHAAAMKAHVNGLSAKAYWSQFDEAPDYVIMFVPGEHFLTAALDHDPALWDYAFDKRVLLATPTNLIAIARTVAAVWRQEKLATESRKIAELGKELHDRLATASEHLRIVGSGLGSAVKRYNDFVGSFDRNVMTSARRFRDLPIDTPAKELPELPAIDLLPRHGGAELLSASPAEAAE